MTNSHFKTRTSPCAGFETVARSIVLLAIMLVGCGPSGPRTYPVSGTVTFNGEPMPDGYIVFTAEDPNLAPETGEILAGQYSFRSQAGPKKVEIQASRFVGLENPVMGLRPREQYVPARYNINTELTADVDPDGDNVFDFELTDEQ